MASLITDNVIEVIGQQIDKLPLALIAPLRAQNYNIAHSVGKFALLSPKLAIVTHCATLASYAAFRRVSAAR
jgi:hypothetical protein